MGHLAPSSDTDNLIAVLERNRVCQASLTLMDWQLDNVLAVMQVPFPKLTDLRLTSYDGMLSAIPNVPDSFLGGSAPLLRHFSLSGIPFPGFPKLLLTATHLVELGLTNIPDCGYISPESVIVPISALFSLKSLSL